MCGSGSVLRIRIRIQKAPEYGSNIDPDPQHCLKPTSLVELRAKTDRNEPMIDPFRNQYGIIR